MVQEILCHNCREECLQNCQIKTWTERTRLKYVYDNLETINNKYLSGNYYFFNYFYQKIVSGSYNLFCLPQKKPTFFNLGVIHP